MVIFFVSFVIRGLWLALIFVFSKLQLVDFVMEIISLFSMHLVLLDLKLIRLLDRHVVGMVLGWLTLTLGGLLWFGLLLFHAVEEVELPVSFRLLGHPWSAC
jgi:hypothetical protein